MAEAVQEMMDAVDCPICMERPANTALSCGHCFCCQEGRESQTFTTCATCRRETAACRTPLYGPVTSLHDILSSKFQMEGLFPKREDARALVGNPAPPKRERGAGAVQSLSPGGTQGVRLAAGDKVVAHFSGRKGCIGWYDATVVEANEDADEYVVDWDDGEKKDTTKKSCDICVHYRQLQAQENSPHDAVSNLYSSSTPLPLLDSSSTPLPLLDEGVAQGGVGFGRPDVQAELRAARAEIYILKSSLGSVETSRKAEVEKQRQVLSTEREAFAREREEWSVEKARLERGKADADEQRRAAADKQRTKFEIQREEFDRERKAFAKERKMLARERETWAAGVPCRLVFRI